MDQIKEITVGGKPFRLAPLTEIQFGYASAVLREEGREAGICCAIYESLDNAHGEGKSPHSVAELQKMNVADLLEIYIVVCQVSGVTGDFEQLRRIAHTIRSAGATPITTRLQ